MSEGDWTPSELIAIAASRLLDDRKVVFAGVGMPLVSSVLAKALHAPHLTVVLEGGIIGPSIQPGNLPISTNEMRAAYRSMLLTDIGDIFLFAQRGFFDYGFLGGAQIDRYGNVNTTVIGDYKSPQIRFPGSGGANDITSLCREILFVTKHEPRRFVEQVDFVTSPGYLQGGTSREDAGLLFGRPSKVVTDLALMDFEPETKAMRIIGLQPGVELDTVHDNTGFDLLVQEPVQRLATPNPDELLALRALDPQGTLLK
jgi:glutaconate CoA-transferase subunit B